MSGSLTLSYEFSGDPDDDFGWLAAKVDVDGFRGANGFWVQWQDVVEFAEQLAQYPLPSAKPVEAEWGYSERDIYTRVTFVSLAPSNSRGGIAVSVDLGDYNDARKRCQLVFETSYSNLAAFRDDLNGVMKKTNEKAVLLEA